MNNYIYSILCGLLTAYFTGAIVTIVLMVSFNRKVAFGLWMNLGIFFLWFLVVFQGVMLWLGDEDDE